MFSLVFWKSSGSSVPYFLFVLKTFDKVSQLAINIFWAAIALPEKHKLIAMLFYAYIFSRLDSEAKYSIIPFIDF